MAVVAWHTRGWGDAKVTEVRNKRSECLATLTLAHALRANWGPYKKQSTCYEVYVLAFFRAGGAYIYQGEIVLLAEKGHVSITGDHS